MLDVNVVGVLNTIQAFVPMLQASPEPSVVCSTASVAGLIRGPVALAGYAASKHVRQLRHHFWEHLSRISQRDAMPHSPWCALRCVHACCVHARPVLTGAYNPTVCPIRGFKAVVALTESLSFELAKHHSQIRVCVCCPCIVATGLFRTSITSTTAQPGAAIAPHQIDGDDQETIGVGLGGLYAFGMSPKSHGRQVGDAANCGGLSLKEAG